MFSIISRRAGRDMVEGTVCSAWIFVPVQDGVCVNLQAGFLNVRLSVSFLLLYAFKVKKNRAVVYLFVF